MGLFRTTSVGLDIADYTIEIAQVASAKGRPLVVSTGRVILDAGIVERGRIKNKEVLTRVIHEVFAQAKPRPIEPKNVVVGLAESQCYTHVFELSEHDIGERAALVAKEAQAAIPLKPEDLMFSYRVLYEENGRVGILLMAADKHVVQEWHQFFREAGVGVSMFDSEALATFRGLFAKPPKHAVCLVDMGALSTHIAIFTPHGLRYSYLVERGGEQMTKDIGAALKISHEKAEKMKREKGLEDERDPVFSILVNAIDPVVKEIQASMGYVEERLKEEIKEVVFVGGASRLKGLVGYMKGALNVAVWIGESVLLQNRSFLEYIEAVGLGLRGLDDNWSKDPAISAQEAKTLTNVVSHEEANEASIEDLHPISEPKSQGESSLPLSIVLTQTRTLRHEKDILISLIVLGIVSILAVFGWRIYHQRGLRQAEDFLSRLHGRFQEIADLAPPVPLQNTQPHSEPESNIPPEPPSPDISLPPAQPPVALPPAQPPTPPASAPPQLVINETVTGWLNVRQGPGTSYAIIGRVYPGERYQQLAKEDDWYKITVGETAEGWVSGEYVTVLP